MKFLSKVKLSNRRYKTPEGYLVCVDSIIARTGKQEYLKSEIFQDSNDDSVIQIDRPKSEVLSPSTIASFENKPLVDEHPDEDVNVDNYRDYAIGFARDVRASKLDDVDILIANLIFTDPEAIAEIESGEKTELSCGYDCDILGEGDNLYQANIRGNHIALCKAGRAGIARIQDSSSKEIREVVNNRYSEKLKDLSPEERIKKIDELIADEEEAIVGYKEAMKYANEADKSIYAHIIAEELEHITELKTLRAENFEKNNINDAGTTRRMFRESEVGDENSWFGTTDWGTPKGNLYIYRKNGKIIAEGSYNGWQNALQKGEKKEFNSVKELNKWLNTFTEDSNIKDSVMDSMTEAKKLLEKNNIKVNKITGQDKNFYLWLEDKTKGNEAVNILSKEYDDVKKYIDSTTKAVKIRVGAGLDNVSFNKKEVEKAINNLGYIVKKWYAYGSDNVAVIDDKYINMDGYPYFNQQVKKLKRFGFANNIYVDDNEIVFEGAKFNIKDSVEDEENKKMRDGALRGIHLKKIRNTLRNEDEDLVEDFLDYMDTRPDLVKEYDDYSDYMVREDFETWKKYKKIKTRDVDTYEEVTEDLEKELKDSDTLKNLAYKFAQMGNYFDRGNSANSRDILGREDNEKIAEFYKLGLQVYKQLEQEVNYLKNNKEPRKSPLSFLERNETVDLLLDGAERLVWVNNSKCEALGNKIRNLIKDYKKYNYRDSKIKDKLENKPINILIKFDSSKEANDALKSLQRKEKFMNSKLIANDTIKVMTTDIDYEELKNILKLYFIKNIKTIDSKVNNSEKLLNIIKLYKKVTKDSKLKDRDFIIEKVIKSAKDSKGQKFYIVLGKFSDKNEKSYLVTSENPNNKYFVGAGTVEKSLNEAEKTLQMYTKDSLQKHNVKDEKKIIKKASDSKLKDVNYEKIVEKVLDENEIYLDDVDYVEDTNRGVEILCTSYYAQLKVKRILEKAFGRVKSANYRTIILAHEDIK